jgi:hypothetical protein
MFGSSLYWYYIDGKANHVRNGTGDQVADRGYPRIFEPAMCNLSPNKAELLF